MLPFHRFRTPEGKGVDPLLGPEMKSTGEVMGFDASFGAAFAKSQAAAYGSLPTSGRVFVSMADRDKRAMIFPVLRLAALGFEVLATAGTAEVLRRHGLAVTEVRKHYEGGETIIDVIMAGDVDMIINTPVRQLRAAHRRVRDPLGGRGEGHPVHHDRAGRGRRGAGDRGDEGGRHRRAVAAGGARGAAGVRA